MTILCSRCGGNHMKSECPTLGIIPVKCGHHPEYMEGLGLPSQLHKEIWNRAIEKAAKHCEQKIGHDTGIRTLKV